jgi:transcriptional regulator with XRE-family HTH domain
MTLVIFGQRLRELRLERGWNQSDLADKLKMSKSTIAEYESGKKLPRPEKLKEIANVFNTSTDYLLGQTNIKEPVDQLQKLLHEKVTDIETIAKIKRPTFRGKIITEEEAKEYNKLFDMFLDMLEAKAEKNAKSGMINAS